MARFQDIPQLTRSAGYMVHVGLDYLADHVAHYVVDYGLDVSPDFQRGYVWRPEQKTRFMEYMLRGGTSGLDIYSNCPTWQHGRLGPEYPDSWFVLVDGKQRLNAALGFLNNEVPVFNGLYFRDFTDRPRITQSNFRWHINDLKTREECLQWYLDLNSGGTVHTEEELEKVRAFLKDGQPYVRPSLDELKRELGYDREVFQSVIKYRAEREEFLRKSKAETEAKAAAKKTTKRGRR